MCLTRNSAWRTVRRSPPDRPNRGFFAASPRPLPSRPTSSSEPSRQRCAGAPPNHELVELDRSSRIPPPVECSGFGRLLASRIACRPWRRARAEPTRARSRRGVSDTASSRHRPSLVGPHRHLRTRPWPTPSGAGVGTVPGHERGACRAATEIVDQRPLLVMPDLEAPSVPGMRLQMPARDGSRSWPKSPQTTSCIASASDGIPSSLKTV